MFTIHQVRLGLATNSSSTHSLIILPGGAEDNDADEGEFGWNFFTCGSKEAKLRYAATQLRSTMQQVASMDVATTVAEAWTGIKMGDAGEYGYDAEYVDHQSLWTLPLDWEGKSVDREFFEDLKSFLLREDVVVLGGNDNDENSHPLDDGSSFRLGVPLESSAKDLVCRKDDGYWVLFNRASGTKIRMSFHDGVDGIEPAKAKTPELVDVKITDFCPYNCAFCYQDSTAKGQHADTDYLRNLAYALGEKRVFEVAIGGGEPTLHPRFVEILETFRRNGIVPNFTTKNLTWLNDHSLRPKILEAAGAFAFSIEKADELKKLAALRDTYEIPNHKLNCQYVMGSSSNYDFEQILRVSAERGLRVTLLGYKTNGRGDQFKPKDYSTWTETLKKVHEEHKWRLKIGIDTALAAEYQGQLADLGIPKWCYEIEEGKFSMYIDAVTKKTAKSSYGPSLTMRPLKETNGYGRLGDEIVQHFAQF